MLRVSQGLDVDINYIPEFFIIYHNTYLQTKEFNNVLKRSLVSRDRTPQTRSEVIQRTFEKT